MFQFYGVLAIKSTAFILITKRSRDTFHPGVMFPWAGAGQSNMPRPTVAGEAGNDDRLVSVPGEPGQPAVPNAASGPGTLITSPRRFASSHAGQYAGLIPSVSKVRRSQNTPSASGPAMRPAMGISRA